MDFAAVAVRREEFLGGRGFRWALIDNDPFRELQDLADLRFLRALPGIDRAAVRDSSGRHGLADRFDALVAGL